MGDDRCNRTRVVPHDGFPRNLLEWTTTAQSMVGAVSNPTRFYRRMVGGIILCIALTIVLRVGSQDFPWIAAPFLLAWVWAPSVARYVSLPAPKVRLEPLTDSDR